MLTPVKKPHLAGRVQKYADIGKDESYTIKCERPGKNPPIARHVQKYGDVGIKP